ncbi:MAG: BatA domain-containing protein [Bacteroidota bacterium]
MLHLLQPIWLLASIGIVIPVAIHLWNIKQGKTLKVGSIVLLTRTSQEYARSLRLTELFLLLLRCLLILLLALFLAKPWWQQTGSGKGWVLMEKKDVQEAYTHFKPLVDSLILTGYEFHLFENGFEKKELSSVLKQDKDTTHEEFLSYWKLVKKLDKKLPPGLQAYLFTGNRLNRFDGDRPAVSIPLKWQTFSHTDSINTFVSKAYMNVMDSIILAIGETTPSVTSYQHKAIAINKPKQNDISLDVSNGNLGVVFKNNSAVLVDTTTLKLVVFSDTYVNDARYVLAALQSIQQVSRRKMKVSVANKPGDIVGKQDWVFWLSDQPVPGNVSAANLLAYEKGTVTPVHSWLHGDNDDASQVSLYKCVYYQPNNTERLWRDGFGNPLLVKETNNTKQRYRFYSHFDPSWNDLVWNPIFPQMIYGLIDYTSSKQPADSVDQRIIGEKQIQLNTAISNTKVTNIENIDTTSAKQAIWIIIFILFFIERIFSFRQKREQAYA